MRLRNKLFMLLCIFSVIIFLGCQTKTDNINPRSDFEVVAQELKRIITHEMQDKKLPAVSIALGTKFDMVTLQIKTFSKDEWEAIRNEYLELACEHARSCAYPRQNVYLRSFG